MPHAFQHAHRDPPHPPPSNPNGGRELLTAEEVAQLLGMGVDWVWAQTRAGHIPSITLGRYRRYRRETIDQWLRDLEMTPPSPRNEVAAAIPFRPPGPATPLAAESTTPKR